MLCWGFEILATNSDLLHSCLDITSACRRAGPDPLLSGGVQATLEEETVGTELLLPETAVSPSGWRTWRYLVVENIEWAKEICMHVIFFHLVKYNWVKKKKWLTCSDHHTSIHLSESTYIFGLKLAIHVDNCTLDLICKSHLWNACNEKGGL